MEPQPRRFLSIVDVSDVALARRIARNMAQGLGFDPIASEEIALVVSELTSNMVKHAGGGRLTLIPLTEETRAGIQIESTDNGPGIRDVEEALRDGLSTAGSLGYGLGVVNRHTDRMDVSSTPGSGTTIVCQRWIKPSTISSKACPLAVGAATRPHALMKVNGDAFVVKRWEENVLVGVIDGLGHGQFAHRAAETARHYVEAHFDQPLEDIFRGVGRSCRATRGVVMALARFDWGKELMTFASIGNIEARVFRSPQPLNFIVRRGVLGGSAPRPVVTQHVWLPQYLFVLHSDGLTSRWHWEDLRHLADEPAPRLAPALLNKFAKHEDDATVVVVRDNV